MNTIERLEMEQMRKNIPVFKGGDTLRVHVKIVEGETPGAAGGRWRR